MSTPALFTIGYEGRDLAGFVDLLVEHRIDTLIDVRELPLSRRKGFSKTPLRGALEEAGVQYVHVRSAGNPYRKEAAADLKRCLRLYREHVERNPETLAGVVEAMKGRRAVLLCVEAESACCHRSVVAEQLLVRGATASVKNL